MENEESPEDIQREMLELIVKAGRRCAYDLSHAAEMCKDRESRDLFHERAEMWKTIFNSGNGPKDYRTSLHRELSLISGENRRLKLEMGVNPDSEFFRPGHGE